MAGVELAVGSAWRARDLLGPSSDVSHVGDGFVDVDQEVLVEGEHPFEPNAPSAVQIRPIWATRSRPRGVGDADGLCPSSVEMSGRPLYPRLFQPVADGTNRSLFGVISADNAGNTSVRDADARAVIEAPPSRRLNIDHLVKGPVRAVQNRLRERRLHAFVGIKFSRDDAFERHRRGNLDQSLRASAPASAPAKGQALSAWA